MKHQLTTYIRLAACVLLLTGCSTTKNLPEGETLYTGIKEITFGNSQKKQKKQKKEEEGVITSLAEAYKTVDELLTTKNIPSKKELTEAQKDSIEALERSQKDAFETVSTEIKSALAYAPNNAIFGSSYYRYPFPFRLMVYNHFVNKTSKFGKWCFNHIAANPVLISTVNPELRAKVAENTLRNYGFFRGTVNYEILPQKKERQAKVRYMVEPHTLFRLDSIAYMNFAPAADSLIQKSWSQRNLHKNDPFSVINLDAERTRLHTLFRNEGLYFYKPEYITFRADTLQRPGFVQLQVVPAEGIPPAANKRYYLGKTTIRMFGTDSYALTDTLKFRDYTIYYNGGEKGRLPLRFGALRRNMFYRKGMLYRQNISPAWTCSAR